VGLTKEFFREGMAAKKILLEEEEVTN